MDEQPNDAGHGAACFFDEHMLHPKATTDAPKFIEFDWEVLRRNLREAREELGEESYALLADVLGELMRWIVKGVKLPIIGRRAVALAWVVNPDMFENGPSAAKLAKRIGCHKAMLSQDAAEASRKFGMRNRAQGHGWNFKPEETDAVPKVPVWIGKKQGKHPKLGKPEKRKKRR